MSDSRWIDLAGTANTRDLGGLPTADGATVRPNRLIRSDNLQSLTPADVRVLITEHDLRAVADLRTGVEVRSEGPGPLTREPLVRIEHLSLFPEVGRTTDAAALDDDRDDAAAPVVLPWQRRGDADGDTDERPARRGAAGVYLGYLADRSDSVLAALRLIAATEGATIVHCAAGKDRTGVITALALSEVGVVPDAIVADYALSAERIERIFARLLATRTYAEDLSGQSIDKHRPRAETMQRVLAGLDEQFGGGPAWLRKNGWTDADAAALREHLLG